MSPRTDNMPFHNKSGLIDRGVCERARGAIVTLFGRKLDRRRVALMFDRQAKRRRRRIGPYGKVAFSAELIPERIMDERGRANWAFCAPSSEL